MDFWSELRSIKLTSPLLFLVVFSFLLTIVLVNWIWEKHKIKSHVRLADIGGIKNVKQKRAGINSITVNVSLLVISLFASLLISGPKSITETTQRQVTTDYLRIVITVTDISSSTRMLSTRFALDEEEKISSFFDVINKAQIYFLSKAQDVIVGVVFFSSEALTYRYPTTDLEELIESLQKITLNSSSEPGKYQLTKLSSGTIATKGLLEAERLIGHVSKNLQTYDSVIVLFTDLELSRVDETKEIIRRLSNQGIRIFIVTDASENQIRRFQNNLVVLEQRIEFFRAHSQQDIQDALDKVAQLQKSPIVQEKTVRIEESLAEELALILVSFLGIFVIFSEFYFRKTRERRRKL